MHLVDINADRQVDDQLGQSGIHSLAELDHVDARLVGDGKGDGRLPVIAHDGERRIAVAEMQIGEVADPDQVALALRAAAPLVAFNGRGLDEEVGDGLRSGELAGGGDRHALAGQCHRAGGGDRILLRDCTLEARLGNAEMGQLGEAGIEVDPPILNAPERHPRHSGDQAQLLLQVGGVPFDLGGAVAVAGDGEQQAIDIAEVIAHGRRSGTPGQLRRDVADLAAQLVPDLGNLLARIGRLDDDLDGGQPLLRGGFEMVDLL